MKLENVRLAGSGTHNIVAVYSGDSLFATSTSSSVALSAESLNSTTTSLIVAPTQASTGTPVSLSGTVAPASGSATPTGDLSFFDGSTVLATLPVNSSGKASFSSASFAVGTHSFTAVYSGDANNLASTSPVISATYTTTTGLPAVTLSQTSVLTFVSSAGSTSAPQTFTVTNSGAANLSITGITITGSTNPNVFAQTNNCPSTLAPSALCTVSVTYTPSRRRRRCSLRLHRGQRRHIASDLRAPGYRLGCVRAWHDDQSRRAAALQRIGRRNQRDPDNHHRQYRQYQSLHQ